MGQPNFTGRLGYLYSSKGSTTGEKRYVYYLYHCFLSSPYVYMLQGPNSYMKKTWPVPESLEEKAHFLLSLLVDEWAVFSGEPLPW